MAATTGIAWTDATVNFVIGCTPVGPGCDDCYAAALAKRKWNITYESGGERRRTKGAFESPFVWERKHVRGGLHDAPTWVFACSLSDFFDNEWPIDVRRDAWAVIRRTPHLRWQIVTKRVGNVKDMMPADWGDGSAYAHVGIIATICSRQELVRDFAKLANLKEFFGVKWIGLSMEPLLEDVELGPDRLKVLDWVIVGGESGQTRGAREFHLEWAYGLVRECLRAGVPIFVKQLGHNAVWRGESGIVSRRASTDPSTWPADLAVQQMPRIYGEVALAPA